MLSQKLRDEQDKYSKVHPDETVPAGTQRRKVNLLKRALYKLPENVKLIQNAFTGCNYRNRITTTANCLRSCGTSRTNTAKFTLMKLSQRAHNVERSTYWRRCHVMESLRCRYDVMLTSFAAGVNQNSYASET